MLETAALETVMLETVALESVTLDTVALEAMWRRCAFNKGRCWSLRHSISVGLYEIRGFCLERRLEQMLEMRMRLRLEHVWAEVEAGSKLELGQG